MNWATLRLSVTCVLTLGLAHAQAPTAPAFDPAKMRAEFAAFNQKPDTVGTGKYPALKEMVASHPNHVIYRPADLSMLGKEKLGVLVWGLSVALAQRPEAHPAFIGLIYGPMGAVKVPADAPPLFVALAADDPLFGHAGIGLLDNWHQAGRPAELHLYQRAGHGFGRGRPGTTTELWPDEFLSWLKLNGVLAAKP